MPPLKKNKTKHKPVCQKTDWPRNVWCEYEKDPLQPKGFSAYTRNKLAL